MRRLCAVILLAFLFVSTSQAMEGIRVNNVNLMQGQPVFLTSGSTAVIDVYSLDGAPYYGSLYFAWFSPPCMEIFMGQNFAGPYADFVIWAPDYADAYYFDFGEPQTYIRFLCKVTTPGNGLLIFESDDGFTQQNPINVNPPIPVTPTVVADAGGPYSIKPGQTITLDSSNTYVNNPTADGWLTYNWGVDDGGWFYSDQVQQKLNVSYDFLAYQLGLSAGPHTVKMMAVYAYWDVDHFENINANDTATLFVAPAFGHAPSGYVAGPVHTVKIEFPDDMDKTSFSLSDDVVSFTGPSGPLEVLTHSWIDSRTLALSFEPQSDAGVYQITIGPSILTTGGLPMDTDADGLAGEAHDTYTAIWTINAAAATQPDIEVTDIQVPANGTAGNDYTISYTVKNAGNTGITASWTDSVFISSDSAWDTGDILLKEITHNGTLAAGATGTMSATVPLPFVLPGNYYIIVRSDRRNDIAETDELNNVAVSTATSALDVQELTANGAANAGTFTQQHLNAYYKIQVTEANKGLGIMVKRPDKSLCEGGRLYLSFNQIPTASDYDFKGLASGTDSIVVSDPVTRIGTYYLAVCSVFEGGYEISASVSGLPFFSADPTECGNKGNITMHLQGVNFDPQMTVELVAADSSRIAAYTTTMPDGGDFWATFNLNGAQAGNYGLCVTLPGGVQSLKDNALTVIDGGGAKIAAKIIMPDLVRTWRQSVFYVEVSNTGTNDSELPAISLKIPAGMMTSTDIGGPMTSTDQIVLNLQPKDCPVPVIRQGTSVRVPIYFQLTSPGLATVTLHIADPSQTQSGTTTGVGSMDPNKKIGPGGVGDSFFVTDGSLFPYTIYFENDPKTATAPAQEIRVIDVLDNNLDLATFELAEIGFANHVISVPAGMSSYETTVDLRPDGIEAIAQVKAELDIASRTVTLTMRAVDPVTGELPEHPLVGLLYPNDSTHRGEGYIGFIVKAKSGLASGTTIENQAKIYFDLNDPIDTPQVLNTIDGEGPSSKVADLPASTTETQFMVSWSGEDGGGSGIASYKIYVSTDGGDYVLWQDDTTQISASFTAAAGHSYKFYSIAQDQVGHVEQAPAEADAVIAVMSSNRAPVAEAGENITAEMGSAAGAEVQLDGSASTDPDGDSISYEWTWAGGAASGAKQLVTLPQGLTTVTLTVSDGKLSSTDTVNVNATDTTPPSVYYPSDIVLEATGPGGAAATFTVSAEDKVDPAPKIECVPASGSMFPIGTTTVNGTATDASGNISKCSFNVTIGDTLQPVITITQPAAVQYAHTATLTLNYSVSDSGSGIQTITAKMDGATSLAGHGLASGQTINLLTEMPLGSHTFSISATDNSGNVTTQDVTFTLIATAKSIKEAVSYFASVGKINWKDEPQSLQSKLDAAAKAKTCAIANTYYQLFINEVRAQSGKKIDAVAAQVLIADAQYLMAHCP